MRGTVLTVSLAAVRSDLALTLEETLRVAQRLAEDARDTGVPVAELVAQATMLGRLDQQREELIGQLRRTASAGLRATSPGPPIREVVLAALDELGWPQNARFLEEYLWAKRQLQLDSRAFASLRRDELRAWRRSPGARSAYIVPALNPDGSANPRWLASSAWDLPRRILAIEPPPVSASVTATRAWRAHVRSHTTALIEAIRRRDDEARDQAASRLAGLPERDRTWGTAG